MTRATHDIQIDRIVGSICVDTRNALLFERLPTGKIVISKVTLNPTGRPAFATARRAFSVPMHCLGDLVALLQRLEAEAHPETQLPIWSPPQQGVA